MKWSWEGFFGYLFNPYLLGGVATTVWLTAAAVIGGLVLGLVIALMRVSKRRWLTGPAWVYTWVFRGTPLLVQLLIIYTGLPLLIGVRLGVIEAALLGLILNEAAYMSEILRAGIQAIGRGQIDAAKSLGLPGALTMRLVVLPQAMRIVIPPLGNSVNGLLKTTSVCSVISMEELLRRTQVLVQEKFLVLELFLVAALYYLLLTTLWDLVQRRLEAHFGRGEAERTADRH